VVDPAHAGADLAAVTGIQRSVPIVASMAEALPWLAAIPGALPGARARAVLRPANGLWPWSGWPPRAGSCRRRWGATCGWPWRPA
jgi:hypothetical protein